MSINREYNSNPFSPAFGMPPRSYIHRYKEESKILNEFCTKDSLPISYMILGARGVGKTVLMHEMANRFDDIAEWVVVRMNPNMDMMDSLLKKLAGHQKLSQVIKSARINLSFFGLSVEMPTSPVRDAEDAITEIIRSMQKNDQRLLVIVDEATNNESMRVFASTYQNLIGQQLPVYLLMTGLYENISSLKNEKNLTFLYRMPRLQLGPLKLSEIAEYYKDVFLLSDSDAAMMAEHTKGYSYAFQLLGKLAWDNSGDYKDILTEYRETLCDMVYEKIWDELSDKDRLLAYGIARSANGSVKEVRSILGWSANELSPYKDRLAKKGLLISPKYGHMELALPYFKGFVLDNSPNDQIKDSLPEDL